MIGTMQRWLFVVTLKAVITMLLWLARRMDHLCSWLTLRLQDCLD